MQHINISVESLSEHFLFYVCLQTGDCHNAEGEEGMCIDGAIKSYTSQLGNYGSRATGENCMIFWIVILLE